MVSKNDLRKHLDEIPVTINDCYGDPLFPKQFANTLYKLKALQGRKGIVTIITKGLADDDKIQQMREYIDSNFAVIYSFTGLNEGNISFDKRVDTLERLRGLTDNLVVLIRPIIPGRNDTLDILADVVDVASDISSVLVYGGYKKDGARHKYLDPHLEKELRDYAHTKGLEIFQKSACAVSYLIGTPCYAHLDDYVPLNVGQVLLNRLGYDFVVKDNKIKLSEGTLGDANFIRFTTRTQPLIENINEKSNILSFSTSEQIYEATSSYFIWSRNIPYCYGCDYCLIEDLEHLGGLQEIIEIGCNPVKLLTKFPDLK